VLKALTAALTTSAEAGGIVPTIHFVEDRYETLVGIIDQAPALINVKLYLVDWGYNTKEHRKLAYESERITLIDGTNFKAIIESFR
jgi:hypothetical protein